MEELNMNQLQHNFNAKTYCWFKLPGKCYVSLNFILWKKKHNLLIKIEVMKESEYITYTLVFMF